MRSEWKEIIALEKSIYSFRPEIQIIFFGLLICLSSWLITDIKLFGHKSTSIFDIWTLAHISIGAVVGYFAIILRSVEFHHPIMLLLLIFFGWEIVEHYIEISNIMYLSDWFGGQENILNRLVGDQVAIVLGFLLIKQKPSFLPLAVLLAGSVLVFHLAIGNSMYLFQ